MGWAPLFLSFTAHALQGMVPSHLRAWGSRSFHCVCQVLQPWWVRMIEVLGDGWTLQLVVQNSIQSTPPWWCGWSQCWAATWLTVKLCTWLYRTPFSQRHHDGVVDPSVGQLHGWQLNSAAGCTELHSVNATMMVWLIPVLGSYMVDS